ncbi:hypothetical protein BB560_003713 [Smittium megazygosporum]|uniref:P-type ATPase A domain-containing protein n=1 Tax=Smittium megazygosporum TaxID=133381 RepID=A0A2T9ZBB9_9FUNG|nr:hypothetical protein BB560_003713 [Smittium megazygosporum]
MVLLSLKFSLPLAVLASLWAQVSAFPAFNTPNKYDVNGNICPLFPKSDVTCPVLCARDASFCPKALDPTAPCPENQSRCADGNCYSDCSAVLNPCACGYPSGDFTTPFIACATYNSTITIDNFNPEIKDTQIEASCLQVWDAIPQNATIDDLPVYVSSWSFDPVRSLMFADCPAPPEPKFDFGALPFTPFYAIVAFFFALNALWYIYKRFRERDHQRFVQIYSTSDNTQLSDTANKTRSITFIGYRNNILGSFSFIFTIIMTLGWIALLTVIVVDYYGGFGGVAYSVFLTSNKSMAIFIFVWHVSSVWFSILVILKDKVRDYYRVRCPLDKSQYVQVIEPKESVILTQSSSALVLKVRHLNERFNKLFNFDKNILTVSVMKGTSSIHSASGNYFEFHCMRFVLNNDGYFFNKEYNLGKTHMELLSHAGGLSNSEAVERYNIIGENFIRVSVPSYFRALFDELTTFFYLYQMMCLWVWFYFNYYKMGSVQAAVILISALYKAYLKIVSERRVKQLAEFEDQYIVKRDGVWQTLSSTDLVPGDVITIKNGSHLACDGAVISGEIVVDESSLTGEAMPVRKFPLKNDVIEFDINNSGKLYTVFSGTKVLQCNEISESFLSSQNSMTALSDSGEFADSLKGDKLGFAVEQGIESNRKSRLLNNIIVNEKMNNLANDENVTKILVLSTRVDTNKGQMVQKIMFPSEYSFVFNEQLSIVIPILLIWGGIAFALTIWLMGHDLTSWFYGIFIISQILSPLLPASFVVGQSVAANRLKKQNIFSIDLPRIMVAGKVKVFCFDKTGTLTREGLEFSGVQPVERQLESSPLPVFGTIKDDVLLSSDLLQIGMATCHSVSIIGDIPIGNPVDIEMFKSTDWEIISKTQSSSDFDEKSGANKNMYIDSMISPFLETNVSSGKSYRKVVHVLKRFEFEHSRQRMCVAVLDPDTNHVHVFVKGSFEKLKRISNPDSIPEDYDYQTAKLASEGCYLLAISHKDLGVVSDFSIFNTISRETMESDCSLLSLIMFRNKLKDDTPAALAELRGGDTRCVMITGDNALTGIYIARESGMISKSARVILGDMEKDGDSGNIVLVWRDPVTREIIDNVDSILTEDSLMIEKKERSVGDIVARRTPDVELAITAACFDHLVKTDTIRKYLYDIRVFSRMTPQGKVAAVKLHMEKCVTAMCGDGGNDCGALRAAHVGLALSEAEASIVSPFSSSNKSIFSCVNLLINGRSALATSFAAYKFLIMYGETMAWLELFQFYFSVIVPESVWIFIDSFIVVGLLFAISQAKPENKLVPYRPTARLLGFTTLTSVIGQIFINLVFLIGIFVLLYRQPWFRCHEFDSRNVDTALWWLLGDNYEAETLTTVLLPQFINAAGVFNFGFKYRKAWIFNYSLVILYFGYMFIMSYVTLANPNRLGCLFRINCGDSDALVSLGYKKPNFHIPSYNSPIGNNVYPKAFRWKIWSITLTNIIVVLLFEFFVVSGPIGRFFTKKMSERKSHKQIIKI